MGYVNVYDACIKSDSVNDRELQKYARKCVKGMEFAVKESSMIENILLKYGPTAYKVEVTLKVFAWKEGNGDE